MESISVKFQKNLDIHQDCLDRTKESLFNSEQLARRDIGQIVSRGQTALVEGRTIIQHVTSETHSFLEELTSQRTDGIDLRPQLGWLQKHISTVVQRLKTAEANAAKALQSAMDYRLEVADTRSEIYQQRKKLKEFRTLVIEYQVLLEDSIKNVEDRLELAERGRMICNHTISEVTAYVHDLQSTVSARQSWINEMNTEMVAAGRYKKKAKRTAIAGIAGTVAGIGLAHVTGGLSLLLTGVGGGAAIDGVNRWDKWDDMITEAEGSVNDAQSNIYQSNAKIKSMKKENLDMESSIKDFKREIAAATKTRTELAMQTSQAEEAQMAVDALDEESADVLGRISSLCPKLDGLNHKLTACNAALATASGEIDAEERVLSSPHPQASRPGPTLNRQKAIIRNASVVLSALEDQIPGTLLGRHMRFLLLEPIVQESEVLIDPIPSVSFLGS